MTQASETPTLKLAHQRNSLLVVDAILQILQPKVVSVCHCENWMFSRGILTSSINEVTAVRDHR
jgi:hypothetical protein